MIEDNDGGLYRGRPHWLSILLAASGVLLCVTAAFEENPLSSVVWWVFLLAVSGLWVIARKRTRAIADSTEKVLDERDLMLRNRSAWWGQFVALTLGSGFAVVLVIGGNLDRTNAEELLSRSGGLLLSLMVLAALAPTVYVSSIITGDDEEDGSE
ncbi:hypothetical protein [Nocardia mexicana]|uniref:Uncharacterized protein n=1 Tax=Nocardia mexicana TaxID=279262 RepID=A0A370GJD5_9NOCA|nr:hypothetical protein [Nocardia mexicana]RDI43470.1 hypothetical protein DFR68_12127 [Nocardia mexicana]